jgi:hypothetical protein
LRAAEQPAARRAAKVKVKKIPLKLVLKLKLFYNNSVGVVDGVALRALRALAGRGAARGPEGREGESLNFSRQN